MLGSHAFAVFGEYVLFAGGYDYRESIQLVRLQSNGTAKLIEECELIGDDGFAVSPAQAVGRGAKLYILAGAVVYEIDLKQVIASCSAS